METPLQQSCELVRSCVRNSQHCYDVYDLLKTFRFDEEICIAGLFHEILENGDMSPTGLRMLGYPASIIELVEVVTLEHPKAILRERHRRLLIKLRQASRLDAWAINMADLLDQLRHSPELPFDDRKYLTKEAAPLFAYSLKSYQETPLGAMFFKEMRDRLSERIPLT
jgi:(p)ppGpp synthase/HD superfamily hydrolase